MEFVKILGYAVAVVLCIFWPLFIINKIRAFVRWKKAGNNVI